MKIYKTEPVIVTTFTQLRSSSLRQNSSLSSIKTSNRRKRTSSSSICIKNHSFLSNNRSMATLTALSLTASNNKNNSNSHKREKDLLSTGTRTSTESRISNPEQSTDETDTNLTRSIPTFRIPKIARPNVSSPSEDESPPSQMNGDIPMYTSQVTKTKPNSASSQQTNDESNSQQGKRKFSLSQYKEHKRLKSNDTTPNFAADVDMRMHTMENLKNSPPTTMDIDSSLISNDQTVMSSKTDDISQDLVRKSNLSEPGVKKLIKKKVIWADEQNQALVQTSVFEIDDSEVADMHAFAHQCASNISLAQIEKLMERDLRQRQNIHSFDNDDRPNLPPLPALRRILLPDTIHSPVVKSQERLAQEEREKTVLQALLTRSFLPDSPGEPDGDLLGNSHSERNEAKSIPLDDNTSSSEPKEELLGDIADPMPTAVSSPSTNPAVTNTPSLSSLALDKLSPEVAQIFAQAKEKLTSVAVSTQINQSIPTPSINPTLPSMQNISTGSNLLSALLNMTRLNGIEAANVPPTNLIGNLIANLPFNFNLLSPSILPINQLAATAISLGLLPPPPPTTTTFNNPVVPATANNFNNQSMPNPPVARFSSPLDQQAPRFNSTHYERHNTNSRGNNRGRIYRRGLHNNTNRRDSYQNRKNNRNVFS